MKVNVLLKTEVTVDVNPEDTAEDVLAKTNIEAEKIARKTGAKVLMTYENDEGINITKIKKA